MRYVTRDGVRIEVGRVLRRFLDAIYIPAPVPPSRVVETWGGLAEDVPDYQDAGYQAQRRDWTIQLRRAHLNAIIGVLAFHLPEAQKAELNALRAVGIGSGQDVDYILFCLDAVEQDALINLVFYQSTVTQRGIDEAAARLNYTWRGKPLAAWAVGYSPGMRGQMALDMRAAIRSGLKWQEFCTLPGPEQSQHVAFWLLEDRLMWLVNNGN